MPIQKSELFHGAVLIRLMRSKRPMTSQLLDIKTGKEPWATYILNNKLAILIKSSTSPKPGKDNVNRWSFTFQTNQLNALKKLNKQYQDQVYVALVCGVDNLKIKDKNTEICLIEPAELTSLIELDASSSQHMSIYLQDNKQLNVRGLSDPIKVPRTRIEQLVVLGS